MDDGSGEIFSQAVHYEWVPPYCSSCKKVGHNCALKKKVSQNQKASAPKTQMKWIPKKNQSQTQAEGNHDDIHTKEVPAQEASQKDNAQAELAAKEDIVVNNVHVELVAKDGVMVTPRQSVEVVHVKTPTTRIVDGGWKTVSRKSKGKGVALGMGASTFNPYLALIEEVVEDLEPEVEGDGGDGISSAVT